MLKSSAGRGVPGRHPRSNRLISSPHAVPEALPVAPIVFTRRPRRVGLDAGEVPKFLLSRTSRMERFCRCRHEHQPCSSAQGGRETTHLWTRARVIMGEHSGTHQRPSMQIASPAPTPPQVKILRSGRTVNQAECTLVVQHVWVRISGERHCRNIVMTNQDPPRTSTPAAPLIYAASKTRRVCRTTCVRTLRTGWAHHTPQKQQRLSAQRRVFRGVELAGGFEPSTC